MHTRVTAKWARHATMRQANVCAHQATTAHNAKGVSIYDYHEVNYQLKSIKVPNGFKKNH